MPRKNAGFLALVTEHNKQHVTLKKIKKLSAKKIVHSAKLSHFRSVTGLRREKKIVKFRLKNPLVFRGHDKRAENGGLWTAEKNCRFVVTLTIHSSVRETKLRLAWRRVFWRRIKFRRC